MPLHRRPRGRESARIDKSIPSATPRHLPDKLASFRNPPPALGKTAKSQIDPVPPSRRHVCPTNWLLPKITWRANRQKPAKCLQYQNLSGFICVHRRPSPQFSFPGVTAPRQSRLSFRKTGHPADRNPFHPTHSRPSAFICGPLTAISAVTPSPNAAAGAAHRNAHRRPIPSQPRRVALPYPYSCSFVAPLLSPKTLAPFFQPCAFIGVRRSRPQRLGGNSPKLNRKEGTVCHI